MRLLSPQQEHCHPALSDLPDFPHCACSFLLHCHCCWCCQGVTVHCCTTTGHQDWTDTSWGRKREEVGQVEKLMERNQQPNIPRRLHMLCPIAGSPLSCYLSLLQNLSSTRGQGHLPSGWRAGQNPTARKTMVDSTGGWRESKCCSSKRLRTDASRRKSSRYLVVQSILQQAPAYLT